MLSSRDVSSFEIKRTCLYACIISLVPKEFATKHF